MTSPSLWVAVLMIASAGAARAMEPEKAGPTPEMRREMAAAHREMSECLESKRPFDECRREMGEEGCPMMGHGGMHGHGMKAPEAPQDEPAK